MARVLLFHHVLGLTDGVIADAAAEELVAGVVYAGFSMSVMQAQRLAQTSSKAAGALLFESCIPAMHTSSQTTQRLHMTSMQPASS